MCLATLSARYPEASPPSYWLSQPGPAGSRPGAPCLLEAPLEKQTPCGHSPTPGTHQGGVPVHPFALLSDCPPPQHWLGCPVGGPSPFFISSCCLFLLTPGLGGFRAGKLIGFYPKRWGLLWAGSSLL